MSTKTNAGDLTAIGICTLAWGTTWYAITWQLGHVDAVLSVAYRFALASLLLWGWCAIRGERLRLSFAQHREAFGVGLFTFAIDYALVYWAEERVTSAVVAVMFATMSFMNLLMFRILFGQKPPRIAWLASGLGAIGVGLLSWSELAHAQMDQRAVVGLCLAFAGVIAASLGNVFAYRSERSGTSIAATMVWAMAYGASLLAVFALLTGREWTFDTRWPYLVSLLHLALFGSVVAFLLYFGVARRRGYGTASYIAALTPILAMVMSALFEGKSWGASAIGGVALVLTGQWLLLRAPKT